MTIDLYTVGLMGATLSPFFILAYLIVKRIHTEALCIKCGEKNWLIEHRIVEYEDQIVDKLVFKCVSCDHVRSEYTGRIKEKDNID